jgi:hypothetical protein
MKPRYKLICYLKPELVWTEDLGAGSEILHNSLDARDARVMLIGRCGGVFFVRRAGPR